MAKLFAFFAALLGASSASAQTSLAELLSELDMLLKSKHPELAASLRPPQSAEQIERMEARYQIVLPDEVRTLYLWHDGQDPTGFTTFANNMAFQPLSELLQTKAEFDSMIGYDFHLKNWWHQAWLPLFHNGGGDYLVVDPQGIHTGDANQLLAFYHDDKYRPIIAKDLTTFFKAVLDYYDKTSTEDMDEFHIIDDFLPNSNLSFDASGKAEPLQ
ncbi:SMI1/KNR4 family protein [Paracoccus albus]|uniref:SMI1/KNR4 family protein n=1 Tax=Paracoccus albus TaxID=3017784 RepID=UPI0022F0B3E8|nr:SMI1/KNR4 family protein [Paracoccus albus]WBU60745.1 SMI1/KNR4 family protein [Paracoccus albus]